MSDAVTQPAPSGSQAPAARDELLIPKHRYDEIAAELRRAREEIGMKDQLYMQERQQQLARSQPQQPEITPEETGLDPQLHSAVVKAAKRIAEVTIAKERQVVEGYVGQLHQKAERAELLATKGADKVKYLPEIQRRQMEHNRSTGGFLPAEIALTLIQADEKDERIRQLEARLAGGQAAIDPAPAQPAQAAPPAPASSVSVPSAAGTRHMPTGGAPAPAAANLASGFAGLSVEEMEARLDERFRGGESL